MPQEGGSAYHGAPGTPQAAGAVASTGAAALIAWAARARCSLAARLLGAGFAFTSNRSGMKSAANSGCRRRWVLGPVLLRHVNAVDSVVVTFLTLGCALASTR